MRKFEFQLQNVLHLREQVRDERRRQLLEAHEAQRLLTEQRELLQVEIGRTAQQGRKAAEPGEVNVDILLEQHRYLLLLQARQEAMRQQSGVLNEEIERRREALRQADIEVRTIEHLRERRWEEHKKAEERREQIEHDEVAVTQWNARNLA